VKATAAKPAPPPARKAGRPRKFPADQMRPRMTFRVREQLRDALTAAALAAGRSLPEEIEFRIEQSFMRGSEESKLGLGGEIFELARTTWDNPGGAEKSLILLVHNYPVAGAAIKAVRITAQPTEPPTEPKPTEPKPAKPKTVKPKAAKP
jgi:hypothetical protein